MKKRKTDKLFFTKMSGAGNDFIIISCLTDRETKATEKFLNKMSKKDFAKKACHRSLGLGADGLLFLHKAKTKGANVRWEFYNSDGTMPEMCANATRCVSRYMFHKTKNKKIKIETKFGIITGQNLTDGSVTVAINGIKILGPNKKVKVKARSVSGGWIDSGVPHFVIKEVDVFNKKKHRSLGADLRGHSDFGSRGANITFIEELKKNVLKASSFERGVEDFTLACGTGAVAAAVFYQTHSGTHMPTKINMPGGVLRVDIKENVAYLNGPAHFVCEGYFSEEVLNVSV